MSLHQQVVIEVEVQSPESPGDCPKHIIPSLIRGHTSHDALLRKGEIDGVDESFFLVSVDYLQYHVQKGEVDGLEGSEVEVFVHH